MHINRSQLHTDCGIPPVLGGYPSLAKKGHHYRVSFCLSYFSCISIQ